MAGDRAQSLIGHRVGAQRAHRPQPGYRFRRPDLGAKCRCAGDVQTVQRRSIDRAGDRFAAIDQRDVDGEFIAAGGKLPGAIKGIDQDEAAGAGEGVGFRHFLGNDRHVGKQAGQPGAYDAIGIDICLCDR